MKKQIRPFYSDEHLAAIYPLPYNHAFWEDHRTRVTATVDMVTGWGSGAGWFDGIDLTCGDGAILQRLHDRGIVQRTYFGDLVPAPHLDIQGRVEDTIVAETYPDGSGRSWDLYVCSETLEHLWNPEKVLRDARKLAARAVFSTPIDEGPEHDNPEHYWSWGVDDVCGMLVAAGWTPERFQRLPLSYYNFQIWCCS